MATSSSIEARPERRATATLVLVWRVADLLCAIDVRDIVEVLPPVACRPIPLSPSWMRGLFPHRGALVPMVDAAGVLALPAMEDRMANRVLVVRTDEGEVVASGERPRRGAAMGLWVHAALDLARIDFRSLASHPGLSNVHARFLGPVGETPWGLAQLVAPRELLDDAQWDLVAGRIRQEAA